MDGFAPSRTPPWGEARCVGEGEGEGEGVDDAAAVRVTTSVTTCVTVAASDVAIATGEDWILRGRSG